MSMSNTRLSVFTKPWKTMSIPALGKLVSGLGFQGIEFPLRDGFQVQPREAVEKLPLLGTQLAAYGLKIMSVAGSTDETTFAACKAAGVPLIRIMLQADLKTGYLNCEQQWLRRLESLEPLCAKYGVRVGVQPHYGPGVFSTMELRHLLEQCRGGHVGAIWDAAHSGLAGEEPEQALDIIWDRLLLVNLKSAFYERRIDGASGAAVYRPYFTTGRDGAGSWPRIVAFLRERGYRGDVCMPAEYTDEANVERHIASDVAYVRELLASG